MWLIISLWVSGAVFGLIYLFLRWNFNYWWYFDVNGPKPDIYFGNLPSAVTKKRHVVYDIWDIYDAYKESDNFVGIFKNRTPQILILNPELAKRIYIQDFKHFNENASSVLVDEKTDFLFGNNPFTTSGDKWKQRRSEIVPGLTLNRIKAMFPITLEICKRMTDYIDGQVQNPGKDGIDAKDMTSRFMADVIADCVMGIQCDSFRDTNAPLLTMRDKIFQYSPVYNILVGLLPAIGKLKKMRFITKEYETYFVGLMETAIKMRKSLGKEADERKDFLNYMLQLQQKNSLTNMEICAHSMTFLLDGFETKLIETKLILMARYPAIQQKLREEIIEKLGNSRDFALIHELSYLNACIHESLRIFPVDFYSQKICSEPIEILNKNGKKFKVPRGMTIIIPKYPIMMDEEFYADASKFQPDRYLEENGGLKQYFNKGVYWCYGDGPRICLGVTFGFVQIKTALVEILTKFIVKPNPKTRRDYTFDPTYFLARLEGGIFLDFESI
ncbi:putative cytochrome P450 28a5 [Haematobia irritans]|uniref:putative cytochrome P450 28a5 n=1 Tax=Haematobia irritans TaxID=7368 RepID=UPI003F500EEF